MSPEPTVKALFMAVTTLTGSLAFGQAPWDVTLEGQQTDFLQEAASTLIRDSSITDVTGLMALCVLYTVGG